MPYQYSLATLPAPTDTRIRLVELPPRQVAVIEFSGWATANKIKKYTQQLNEVLADHDMETRGASSLNQYNPPWTPPFLRRNEIMVELGSTDATTAQ